MSGGYGVIYADPPWKFKTYSDKGKGRSAEAWYDCMDIEDIKRLDILQYAADDCVLLMWVTDPFLEIGFDVIRSWGFKYKTVGFVWAKYNDSPSSILAHDARIWPIGTGYWTRANPEQCLLATRGHPKRINNDVRKLVISPRREHSQKPDEMYGYIERLCSGPYLELFARQTVEGWDCVGNESETGPGERRWKSNSGLKSSDLLKGFSLK